eukprot:2157363-Alexandrium_andersonii.AAC.1
MAVLSARRQRGANLLLDLLQHLAMAGAQIPRWQDECLLTLASHAVKAATAQIPHGTSGGA